MKYKVETTLTFSTIVDLDETGFEHDTGPYKGTREEQLQGCAINSTHAMEPWNMMNEEPFVCSDATPASDTDEYPVIRAKAVNSETIDLDFLAAITHIQHLYREANDHDRERIIQRVRDVIDDFVPDENWFGMITSHAINNSAWCPDHCLQSEVDGHTMVKISDWDKGVRCDECGKTFNGKTWEQTK